MRRTCLFCCTSFYNAGKKNATKQLPILTQKELLQQLKISPNTLKSWERKGLSRLEPPIENTRTVFYKISDVIDFLSK
ncbi:MerR family transcriptional regulator [Streptococcus suis]